MDASKSFLICFLTVVVAVFLCGSVQAQNTTVCRLAPVALLEELVSSEPSKQSHIHAQQAETLVTDRALTASAQGREARIAAQSVKPHRTFILRI